MTPVGPPPVAPGGDLELADVSRLAVAALRTDGLLVVDERTAEPCVVIAEGFAGKELARRLDDLALLANQSRDGEERVHVGICGERRILSTSLSIDSGQHIGTLYAIYGDSAAVPAHLHALVRAFARHIGFALGRGAVSPPDHRNRGVAFPWDDLERLPEAINEITRQVTEVIRPLTGATAVGITIWDPDHGILRALPEAFGATDGVLSASVTGPPTNMFSVGARVFATGRPYMSNHASGDPGILQPYVEIFHIRRILSVPLNNGSRRIGVLHLVNKPSDFTTDDIAAAESVTPHVAMAVELAQSVARMAAQQRLEGILTRAAVAIASGKQVEDCLLPAFDQLGAVTGASLVALVPLESAPLIRRTGPFDSTLERRLLVDARKLSSTSLGAFPHQAGDPGWAALHAPVELHGERTATLSVLRRNGEPFTTEEQDVVSRLATLVALAWATERYQHQLAEIARLRERERIADGLHDRVTQILFAAQLGIDTVLESATVEAERQRMIEVRDLMINGDTAIREVIHRLAAAPGTNLARRLRLEVESVEEEFGVVVHVEIPGGAALCAVPRPVADAVVKVAREGTINAAKHAGPCRIGVEIRVNADGELVMSVVDDGLGLLARPDHGPGHGIGSLHRTVEDAGGSITFTKPVSGFGTRVVAKFAL